jgi:hypothetical protein
MVGEFVMATAGLAVLDRLSAMTLIAQKLALGVFLEYQGPFTVKTFTGEVK